MGQLDNGPPALGWGRAPSRQRPSAGIVFAKSSLNASGPVGLAPSLAEPTKGIFQPDSLGLERRLLTTNSADKQLACEQLPGGKMYKFTLYVQVCKSAAHFCLAGSSSAFQCSRFLDLAKATL